MPAPRRSTRSRIIEAARLLFWLRGYSATSIDDILAEAGAGSGSFYHLFPSKELLLLTVIRNHTAAFNPAIAEPACKLADHPVLRVIAIMRHYRQNLIDSDFACGCPAGKLALEIPLDQPLLLGALDQCFRTWRSTVEKCLQDMREDLPRATDYSRLASVVLTLVQGAILQCRVARAIQPFDDAIQIFAIHIDHLVNQRYWEKLDEKREARRKKRAALLSPETENSPVPLDSSAPSPSGTLTTAREHLVNPSSSFPVSDAPASEPLQPAASI
jgi:AcrR family transcriptional regulator